MSNQDGEEVLVDYEGDEVEDIAEELETGESGEKAKGHYVGVHSSGFRDFLLTPQLLEAIVDCGFENPSEVQHECIPHALSGADLICQAKSGMGKTAVFVLSTLSMIEEDEKNVAVVVIAHTRELAFQISKEYQRFSKRLNNINSAVFYGGIRKEENKKVLRDLKPQIVIGTPGRLMDLCESGSLDLSHVKHFIVDECDKVLETTDMRSHVQKIFMKCPKDKQVMMFSATMSDTTRPLIRKFMNSPQEVFVDSEAKLTLHGLHQYFVNLTPREKNRKLTELLDNISFNQVVIFVSEVSRARELDHLLRTNSFPSMTINGSLKQTERIKRYQDFKEAKQRILVATDLFGRGIDIERVNLVINYDFPRADNRGGEEPADQYLHRVGRAGRFGTKGLAISFISSPEDKDALASVQSRFEVEIPEMPEKIDVSEYTTESAE